MVGSAEPPLADRLLGVVPAQALAWPERFPFSWAVPRELTGEEERTEASLPRSVEPPAPADDCVCGGWTGDTARGDCVSPVRFPESCRCPGERHLPPVLTMSALPNFLISLILTTSTKLTNQQLYSTLYTFILSI